MKPLIRFAFLAMLVLGALPLLADEAIFDRTLKVSGPVDLEVVTGSGSITVRSGAAGTVSVHGIVRSGFCLGLCGGDPEAAMKAIVADPPIEQSGNTLRIGHLGETLRHNNISLSYELVVPADTKLLSKTGSGAQEISGVAGPAEISSGSGGLRLVDIAGQVRAHTGSGSITLTRLRSSVRAHTGSGGIRGEGIGSGNRAPSPRTGNSYADTGTASDADIDFQTGSGSIRVNDVHGAVRAHTGSGTIELEGQPTGDWNMSTGSGGIVVRLPAQAAFYVNAHTSSGGIHTDRQVTTQGEIGKHDLRGSVNGGGFRLDLRTGSGSIRIE